MPESQRVPEFYGDFVRIMTGELGVFLGVVSAKPLDVMPPNQGDSDSIAEMPSELKAIVRLGHPQAKILAILLKRSLKEYEQETGTIPLPSDFLEQLDMLSDEW